MTKLKRIVYWIVSFTIVSCGPANEEEVLNYNYGNDSLISANTTMDNKQSEHWPASFGIGREATRAEIKAWDIDISPDGKSLPDGEGNVETGKIIYETKCIICHGKNGTSGSAGRLLGVMGDTTKTKTIGNYWPYSTTLFDYIRRAMPYNAPGSLKDNEVYSLSAYLLYINKIIDSTTAMNRKTLPKVKMPAQPYFINDDRRGGPEVR
jgi:cytochrome c